MPLSASGSSRPKTGGTGNTFLCAFLLGGAAFAPQCAWALFSDHVEVWAAENITHDTNVLRLSRNIAPADVGAPQRGDTIYSTHAGISADIPVSLQRFQGAITVFHNKYDTFRAFDFTGHTIRGEWDWVINPAYSGTLGYTESKGLSSFANIQNFVKDIVTSRQAYATGSWLATPRWRATAGVTAGESRHDDPTRNVNDIDVATGELGLAYVTPLENTFGGVVRYERGRSPHGVLFGVPFDNAYNQVGAGGTVGWSITPHSRLDGRVEFVRRTYDERTERNYNGPIARAIYTWTPTPKFTLATSIYRDVGPADDVTTSFVLMTGGYIRPRWAITEKVTLQANGEYNVWDYRGDPLTGGNFTHHQRLYGASIAYRPTRKILLQAGYNHETRSSTLRLGDYDVEVAYVEGRIGF
jgi:exopolysaccharide biosynthesis operon protein EpsL